MAEASATAEGELARTPFAHLLVYALDRRLTGDLFLSPPGAQEHVVRLDRGVPIKIRPGDRFALLGDMLVEAGAIDSKTLADALATKGLLGDVLLLAGRIERDVLEKIAEEQFLRRMVRLFALPPDTGYRYYDEHDALAEYGGDPTRMDPLALLWAGIRTHGEVSTMMEGTLARLGDTPLRLHAAATVSRFELDADEADLLDALATRPLTLAELCSGPFPGTARRFAYALAITRQIELGTNLLPLGADVAPNSPLRSPPPTAVGRLALRSTVHRMGAAAPDAPGDGERGTPVVPLARRHRDRTATAAVLAEEPKSQPSSTVPPISSVESIPPAAPGPSSGVIPIEPPSAREPEVARSAPVDRDVVESPTMRSQIAPSLEVLRAAAMADLEPSDGDREALRPPAPRDAGAPEDATVEGAWVELSSSELFWVAAECLAERDVIGCLEACEAGLRAAPEDLDLVALCAWARAQLGGADLKALAVELDEVLHAEEGHAEARYYRAMIRARLGDEAGSERDLRRVLEIAPDHEGASRELAIRETRQSSTERPSLLGKLLKH